MPIAIKSLWSRGISRIISVRRSILLPLVDACYRPSEAFRNIRRKPFSEWRIDLEALRRRMRGALKVEGGHIYFCLHDFMPPDMYKACVTHWPTPRQFRQRKNERLRMPIAQMEASLSLDVQAFWAGFAAFIDAQVKPLVVETFMPYLWHKFDWIDDAEKEWLRANLAFERDPGEGMNLDRWFSLGAHVDQAYIFASSLIYLPTNASQEHRGTSFFVPKTPTRTIDTKFIQLSDVTETRRFPFLPNTLVSFLQTPTSFHGTYRNGLALKLRKSYHFNVHLSNAVVERVYGRDHLYRPPAY